VDLHNIVQYCMNYEECIVRARYSSTGYQLKTSTQMHSSQEKGAVCFCFLFMNY